MPSFLTKSNVLLALLVLLVGGLVVSCKKSSDDAAPAQFTFSPASALAGDTLTLTGTNFDVDKSKDVVQIGGKAATVISATATQLQAIVPSGATSGKISLTVGTGSPSSSSTDFVLNNIYIAGFEFNGTNRVAKYWKNGVATSLTDGTKRAVAVAIAVSGNDIYVAGTETNTAGKDVAKYWKNGVATSLGAGIFSSFLSDIEVVGNDVYAVGNENNSDRYGDKKYWKNGVGVTLPLLATNDFGAANAIAVVGNDVHVVGLIVSPSGNGSTTSPNALIARYWKNGVVVPFSGVLNESEANDIAVVGNDVYIAGAEAVTGGRFAAKYWKNGVGVPFTDGTQAAIGWAIAVSGNDVYVAGQEINPATTAPLAKYWKNTKVVNLATSSTASSVAYSIAVSGNNVYAAGYENNASGRGVAKYWKNGTAVNLTDGSQNAAAYKIIIAP